MDNTLLFPKKVVFVPQGDITDGTTITDFDSFETNGTVHIVDKFGDDQLTGTDSSEALDQNRTGSNGVSTLTESFTRSKSFSFTVPTNAFNMTVLSILRGQRIQDLETTQTANINGTEQSDIEGIDLTPSVLSTKLSMLAIAPVPGSNDKIYLYVPKCTVSPDDFDVIMSSNQQQNQEINMRGLALTDAELTAHQTLYDAVTENGLWYKFKVPGV